MQLCGILTILVMTLSTACGLLCYTCATTDRESCQESIVCSDSNRCFSIELAGFITKGCKKADLCPVTNVCCEGNLCNSAIPTGPSAIFLLLSSAIITLFL